MKGKIILSAPKHLGDYTAITNTLYNIYHATKEYACDIDFGRFRGYHDLFRNNPYVNKDPIYPAIPIKLQYGDIEEEKAGKYGCYTEGYVHWVERTLAATYGITLTIPVKKLTADFHIKDEEYTEYPIPYENYCVLGANVQISTETKGYPYWQEVIDLCPDIQFVQVGNDKRDIRANAFKGAVDLRGKTSIRNLILLISKASYVLSGPTSLVHIGSAFPHVKKVVLVGARDPATFYKYPNTVTLHTYCGPIGNTSGCISMSFGEPDSVNRRCNKYCFMDGRSYACCMASIPPEQIAEELNRKLIPCPIK